MRVWAVCCASVEVRVSVQHLASLGWSRAGRWMDWLLPRTSSANEEGHSQPRKGALRSAHTCPVALRHAALLRLLAAVAHSKGKPCPPLPPHPSPPGVRRVL